MQSIATLYNDVSAPLGLKWRAGLDGAFRILSDSHAGSAELVGHLNLIHASRIQVIGQAESDFFDRLSETRRLEYLNDFLHHGEPPALIMADGVEPPNFLVQWCEEHVIPLFCSAETSARVIEYLRVYFNRLFAERCSRHGVLMDVLGVGVLISGESGLGKSELALELISRGHGLVADDAVEIYRIGPETLEGRCPPVLRDFLEVRGLGVLNIRAIFGETAIRPKKPLKLIINLVSADDQLMQSLDRLSIQSEKQDILNVHIRKVSIPVAAGRNLAVLVEAAVRNFILQSRGLDSTKQFIERHTQVLKEDQLNDESHSD